MISDFRYILLGLSGAALREVSGPQFVVVVVVEELEEEEVPLPPPPPPRLYCTV